MQITKNHVIEQLIDIEALALEVAKNKVGAKLPIADLLFQLDVTEEAFTLLLDNELFTRQVVYYTKELTDSGESFAMKARLIAEDLLGTQYRLLKNPDTPASVVVAGIANIVRWGGLEKKANDTDGIGANKISINISLDAGTPRVTLSNPNPITINQET